MSDVSLGEQEAAEDQLVMELARMSVHELWERIHDRDDRVSIPATIAAERRGINIERRHDLGKWMQEEGSARFLITATRARMRKDPVSIYIFRWLLEHMGERALMPESWMTPERLEEWLVQFLEAMPDYSGVSRQNERAVAFSKLLSAPWAQILPPVAVARLFEGCPGALCDALLYVPNDQDYWLERLSEGAIDGLIGGLGTFDPDGMAAMLRPRGPLRSWLLRTRRLTAVQVARVLTLPLDAELRMRLVRHQIDGARRGR